MTLQKREGLKVGDVGSLNFYFFFGLGFERWVSFFGWEDLLVERSWCWFFFLLLRGEQTWQWKIPIVNREYIFKRSIFHCHLSLRRLYRYAFHIHISSLTFCFPFQTSSEDIIVLRVQPHMQPDRQPFETGYGMLEIIMSHSSSFGIIRKTQEWIIYRYEQIWAYCRFQASYVDIQPPTKNTWKPSHIYHPSSIVDRPKVQWWLLISPGFSVDEWMTWPWCQTWKVTDTGEGLDMRPMEEENHLPSQLEKGNILS